MQYWCHIVRCIHQSVYRHLQVENRCKTTQSPTVRKRGGTAGGGTGGGTGGGGGAEEINRDDSHRRSLSPPYTCSGQQRRYFVCQVVGETCRVGLLDNFPDQDPDGRQRRDNHNHNHNKK